MIIKEKSLDILIIYKPSISKPIRIDLNNWVSSNHNLKIKDMLQIGYAYLINI